MFIIPLSGAANIAIGGHAATNGIIYGIWALLVGAGLALEAPVWWHGCIASLLCTVFFVWWRSQSPRNGELDLLYEPTFSEAKQAFYTHLWPLLCIGWVTGVVWLPALALVSPAGHLLVSNIVGLGRWLMKQGRKPGGSIFDNHGYHRRVGELLNGIFIHGIALHLLAFELVRVIASTKINWSL